MERVSPELEPSYSFSHKDEDTSTAFEVLNFRAYSTTNKRTSEDVLLFDKAELRHSTLISNPVVIYVNLATSITSILNIDESNERKPVPEEDGYSLLLEVYPHFIDGSCRSFTVMRCIQPNVYNQLEFLRSTFIIIGPDRTKVKLKDKDVIKLGREKYLVRFGLQRYRWFDQVYFQKDRLEGTCRICLSDQSPESDDYLVSPCRCNGTMAPIHISCLRNWVSSKIITKKVEGITTYAFQKLDCEICKSEFPKFICTDSRMLEVMPMDCGPHAILLEKVEFNSKRKLVHCINLTEGETRELSLGRSEHNHIQLEDMSVSRIHCKLVIGPEGVEIYDCRSKFGTFVMLRGAEKDLRSACYMNYKWRFQLSIAQS